MSKERVPRKLKKKIKKARIAYFVKLFKRFKCKTDEQRRLERIRMVKEYAEGKQDIEQYKKMMNSCQK